MRDSKQLRIVYMGTPEFAVEPLRLLVGGGYNVVGVVTVPDKPAGRGLRVQESAVKQYAVSQGLPIFQPEKLRDEEWLRTFRDVLQPDLCIVVAFRMLPEVVWGWPRLGTFNLHASLLPDYRGAAPINRAVMNGEPKTGVTTFFLNDRIDCGGIIEQLEVPIAEEDTAGVVHDRLMSVGARLVVQTVERIAAVAPERLASSQQEGALSEKPAPKLFKEDCRLDFSAPVRTVYNKVRGLAPFPGAWAELRGLGAVRVLSSHYEVVNGGILLPAAGEFECDGRGYLRVSCLGGWLYIDRLQAAGKRAMPVEEFLRGARLSRS